MMNKLRSEILNDNNRITKRSYVLYHMQQSARINYNHALNEAIKYANKYELPLAVYFCLTDNFPEANLRHYTFMLEGLSEVVKELELLNISFILKIGDPVEEIKELLKNAQALFLDKGVLRFSRKIKTDMMEYIDKNESDLYVELIDTDLLIPVSILSNKIEYGAYTIRPKVFKVLENFRDFYTLEKIENKNKLSISLSEIDIDELINKLLIDKTVKVSPLYRGGYSNAVKYFNDFYLNKLKNYYKSSDPSLELTSKLSMYIHFGQISVLEIYDRLEKLLSKSLIDATNFNLFVEQLIVRRELAHNFVYYNENYDNFYYITEPWVKDTLLNHQNDKRMKLYTVSDYTNFNTHDKYFNALMKEMIITGYLPNYLRMYFGKKIIEWTDNYYDAYETIKYLNNKYLIDGRDANSFAAFAWCFGKHDRPFIERPIFGKLRYMNEQGLTRKFKMDNYLTKVKKIDKLL